MRGEGEDDILNQTEKLPFEMVKENGHIIFLVDGWAVDDQTSPHVVKFGIFKSELGKFATRCMWSYLAQYYGLVAPGLILTKHIFCGLKRPLFCDQNMNGDVEKLIHSWKPTRDYEWRGDAQGDIEQFDAPSDSVFVTIISKNIKHTEEYPSVYGWVDKWNWVPGDSLIDAPVNWAERYEEKLYPRNGG